MRTFELLFYVLAALCFAGAALWPAEPANNLRIRLLGLGLALWVIVPLVVLARA